MSSIDNQTSSSFRTARLPSCSLSLTICYISLSLPHLSINLQIFPIPNFTNHQVATLVWYSLYHLELELYLDFIFFINLLTPKTTRLLDIKVENNMPL
ncbi:hypothetical protein QBC44DRAFT_324437 [Cladorrhinum sp. PSN332]|nr:hypothetical protein QBC44DRAFT_324437 [Cladorrhinum sp. PSN332]